MFIFISFHIHNIFFHWHNSLQKQSLGIKSSLACQVDKWSCLRVIIDFVFEQQQLKPGRVSKVVLGVCSIRVLTKNPGDPYYEPTIVVRDTTRWRAGGLRLPDAAWTSQVQKYLVGKGLTIVTMAARRIIHNQHIILFDAHLAGSTS